MRILGHGIDIIEISRIDDMLAKHEDRFLERVFTEGEQAHGAASRRRSEHLAGRFAAKEAVYKALGTGNTAGIAWTDIEVVSLPSGKPTLRLLNNALDTSMSLGITEWHLSISHSHHSAVASAIACGPD
ncbi:MAG: holo-ACP synthase [Phycisphaerales bacterium]|jgi:holo-[acyl-carrier protein] synthase